MTGTFDLTSTQYNGAWLVAESKLGALGDDARAQGYLVRRIELAGCRDKHDLLRRTASALALPSTFGMNWDALADCLGDLAWLPPAGGHAWLFEHAEDLRSASAPDFDTLYEVLDEACARWKGRDIPCFAFLGDKRDLAE